MKSILIIAILIAVALAKRHEHEYRSLWRDWKVKHEKNYETPVLEATRYEIFKGKVDFIDNFNKENHTYTVGLTVFADLTFDEFRATYLRPMEVRKHKHVHSNDHVSALPSSWDWRTAHKYSAVTAIKNQGQCGSCWSFSTTGSVEGCVAIATKSNAKGLSEQNLVDCSDDEGNEGCDGGLMDDAFEYIIQNKGIDSESCYPYTAEDGTCSYSASCCAATITSYTDVTSGSESALQTAVYGAPVSVAMDASQDSFQLYTGGIYSDPNCSTSQLDHGVLAIGWGSSSGSPYWIVKNSWGTSWGINGFFWMARNDGNMCGIATSASYPTGCSNKCH
jgi:cathepsin L